jgi:hypothetical protein
MEWRGVGAALLLAGATGLGGCTNYVVSSAPWFAAEDARQAPAVRSGWWKNDDPDCRFSAEAPSSAWPECAAHILLPPGDRLVLSIPSDKDVPSVEYLLAPGDPSIVQIFTRGDDKAAPATMDEYGYYGLKPGRWDAEQRITAFEAWAIVCGPPQRRSKGHPFNNQTRRLWPGLDIRKEDGGCTARNVEALRDAARRSEKLVRKGSDEPLLAFHWIRDWRPGDQTQEEWLAAGAEQSH